MTLNYGKSSSVDSAERLFLASIELARRQSARSFELRTAVSLGAAELLLPVVRTFTEGLLTSDIKEALELANELGAEIPGDHEWSSRV
jgi:hypothetical protein